MKLYVDTGRDETDRMAECALRELSDASCVLAVCRADSKIPADATHAVVICRSDDYLTSSVHSALSEKFGGAYGYIRYPISLPLLIRTVREITRVKNAPAEGFTFDRETRTVTKSGTSAVLSEKEADLFSLLLSSAGKPISREDLRECLWQSTDGTNVPDVYVSYLRRKLTPILGEGFIVNVRGAGYMLREN